MDVNPIYLASNGRSGSTLMMKILSLHPKILVRSIFPYETRASQYYYLCAQKGYKKVSFSPVKQDKTEYRPFSLKDKDSIGWSQSKLSTAPGNFGFNLINDYYKFLLEIEDKKESNHFAEKTIGIKLLRSMINDLPGSKVIFLYRDPRDIFFSAKSFNRKRGNLKFGEDKGDLAMYSQIIEFLKKTKKLSENLGSRAITVSYENLIEDTRNTVKTLFKGLDLELTGEQVEKIIQRAFEATTESDKHKTTDQGKSSVGKWRDEVDDQTKEIFQTFNQEIEYLGYGSK